MSEPTPLQWQAVPTEVATLLRALMMDDNLAAFHLVGGTALALQLGHRMSIDIDLFTESPFDAQALGDHFARYWEACEVAVAPNTVRCILRGVKVDAIAHRYPLLEPPVQTDGIRMVSLPDLVAMKLNAITNRGSRKDFWDIAALLDIYPLDSMLGFLERKYVGYSLWHVEKSLSYLADADAEGISPRDLHGLSWDDVKRKVLAANKRTR